MGFEISVSGCVNLLRDISIWQWQTFDLQPTDSFDRVRELQNRTKIQLLRRAVEKNYPQKTNKPRYNSLNHNIQSWLIGTRNRI